MSARDIIPAASFYRGLLLLPPAADTHVVGGLRTDNLLPIDRSVCHLGVVVADPVLMDIQLQSSLVKWGRACTRAPPAALLDSDGTRKRLVPATFPPLTPQDAAG